MHSQRKGTKAGAVPLQKVHLSTFLADNMCLRYQCGPLGTKVYLLKRSCDSFCTFFSESVTTPHKLICMHKIIIWSCHKHNSALC